MSFKPKFEKGLILKDYMLDAIRDNPEDYIKILYNNYGDGIISGFNITASENEFNVEPGIVKISSEVYAIKDSMKTEAKEGSNIVYLKVEKLEKIDGIEISYELVQSEAEETRDDLFELFRYTKNANVYSYKDLDEVFSGTINRIDRTHVLSAVNGGNTLLPEYFKLFGAEVIRKEFAGVQDVAFAYQAMNGIEDICVVTNYFKLENNNNSFVLQKMKEKLAGMGAKRKENKEVPKKEEKRKYMTIS